MTDGKAVEIRTEDGRVVVGPGALELISSWEWLQEANRNARRGKRTRPSIMQYQDDLEHNLIQTGEEMRAGTYRTGPYQAAVGIHTKAPPGNGAGLPRPGRAMERLPTALSLLRPADD